MDRFKKKLHRRSRIKQGIRKRISGTSVMPRLSVYRSNSEIYVQVIDDVNGVTLAAASSLGLGESKMAPVAKATEVGKAIANKAKEANITNVVFDRNGYLYHGRVKALAEGAREGGLNF